MGPIFSRDIRRTILWDSILVVGEFTCTGLSPSMASRSRPLPFHLLDIGMGPKLHIPCIFQCRIRFALFPFHSPLLRESLLISFPLGTRMFRFPRFPFLTERCPKTSGSPIRASSDLRLHAPSRGISPLGTPFFSSRAKPSTSWLEQTNRCTDPFDRSTYDWLH